MITQKFFKLPDKLIFFIIILFYTQIFNLDAKSKVCETLLDVLEINTNAYKNCLLKKSGEKYSREELNTCKKYYLTEIERLSYVFKNTCKKN